MITFIFLIDFKTFTIILTVAIFRFFHAFQMLESFFALIYIFSILHLILQESLTEKEMEELISEFLEVESKVLCFFSHL